MRYPVLAALALSLASPAFAGTAVDAAYDKNASTVRDSRGNCVRTKWQGAADPCGARTEAAPLPEVSLEQRTVYFDFNSAALTGEAMEKLDQLAEIINGASEVGGVRIHGFTDQIGSHGYNGALAKKRAAAVKAYLDGKSRLKTTVGDVRGIGKSNPQAECVATETRDEQIACMATERRVEIELRAKK